MTAHQKLIQRHSPKWDQPDMPVFHLKAPDMFPEFFCMLLRSRYLIHQINQTGLHIY